jgi:hypothetical protein
MDAQFAPGLVFNTDLAPATEKVDWQIAQPGAELFGPNKPIAMLPHDSVFDASRGASRETSGIAVGADSNTSASFVPSDSSGPGTSWQEQEIEEADSVEGPLDVVTPDDSDDSDEEVQIATAALAPGQTGCLRALPNLVCVVFCARARLPAAGRLL